MKKLILQGDILISDTSTIHIKRRKSGALYLFQEIPSRKYISGLLPRPDLGARTYQFDVKIGRTRKYYTLTLGDGEALLRQFSRYNNRNCLQKM